MATFDNKVYFLTFIDAYSGHVTGFLLQNKSEVFEKFKEYESLMSNKIGRRMKILRTDNGTEFLNNAMKTFLKEKGIEHQTTCRYTPQQNGIAERMNRTIMEKVRCMLFDGNCPLQLWGLTFAAAIVIINRLIPAYSKITPHEAVTGLIPNPKLIKRFGCIGMVHVPEEVRNGKLDYRSSEENVLWI